MDTARYTGFLGLAVLLALVPGADLALVLRTAVVRGQRAGVATALGTGLGSLAQGAVASSGLVALASSTAAVFDTLRWVGVAYLLFLGTRSLYSARRLRYEADPVPLFAQSPPKHQRTGQPFLEGLGTNTSNPKVLLFYLSVLPQFLPVHPSLPEVVLLAATLPVLGTSWLLAVVAITHAGRHRLTGYRTRSYLETLVGVSMLSLATGLAAGF